MGLRLTVDTSAWREHVIATAARVGPVIPVVKGNGYGFGRASLAALAADLLPDRPDRLLAVGTVHETREVPLDARPLVLTPTVDPLPADLPTDTVLTVGAAHHVDALTRQGWHGDVVLKLASSMRRYGTDDPAALASTCRSAGLTVIAASVHLPLAGDPDAHRAEVEHWLPTVDHVLGPDVPVDVSHLTEEAVAALRSIRPTIRVRMGTALWHGDKSALHLTATVTDVHRVAAGDRVGYRQVPVAADGWVALVAAGSAHGVHPLDGGLSPFHWNRRRLPLIEPPHMHTSMVLAADGGGCPRPGDVVDVQRPLVTTSVDEVAWR